VCGNTASVLVDRQRGVCRRGGYSPGDATSRWFIVGESDCHRESSIDLQETGIARWRCGDSLPETWRTYHAWSAGCSSVDIAMVRGHKSIESSQVFIHPGEEQGERVSQVLGRKRGLTGQTDV
jgi:hypothetical protein